MLAGTLLFLLSFFLVPERFMQKKVFYAVIVAPFFLSLFFFNYRSLLKDKMLILASIIIIYLGASVLWSPFFSAEVAKSVFRDASYLLALVLVTAYVFREYPQYHQPFLYILCTVATVVGLVLIYHLYAPLNWDFDRVMIVDWKFRNQNRLSKTYGLIGLLGISLAILSQRKAIIWGGCITGLVSIIIVLLTKSKGGAYAVLLTLPLLIFLRKDIAKEILKNWRFITIAFVMVLIVLIVVWQLDVIGDFTRDGWSKRNYIWPAVIEQAQGQWLLGTGYLPKAFIVGTDGHRYYHEHNLFLALLRQGGLIVLFLMATFLLVLILRGIKSSNQYHRLWAILLFYGVMASQSGGRYPLNKPDDDWMWLWIPIAYILAMNQIDMLRKHNDIKPSATTNKI